MSTDFDYFVSSSTLRTPFRVFGVRLKPVVSVDGGGLSLNTSEVMRWEHVEKKIKVRSSRCRTGKVSV